MTARQGLASSDTRHLCEILDSLPRPPQVGEILRVPEYFSFGAIYSRFVWTRLFHNRQNTFRLFLSKEPIKCQEWLLFQTVCTDNFDPFLDTFQILLLIDDWRQCIPKVPSISPSPIKNMLICLVEAQCELSDEIDDGKHPSFNELIAHVYKGKQGAIDLQLVAAGTSLQLKRFKNVLEDFVMQSIAPSPGFVDPISGDKYERYRSEVLHISTSITGDAEFKTLLRHHIHRLVSKMDYLRKIKEAANQYELWEIFAIESPQMIKETFFKKVACHLDQESSSKHSIEKVVQKYLEAIGLDDTDREREKPMLLFSNLFRGRIRWNTLFIEQLFIECLQAIDDPLGYDADRIDRMSLIKKAAQIAQDTIVKQLQARIEELSQKGRHFLLKDLFLTAVRADLMNKPSVFPDTESVQMVTEGFALLKASKEDSASGSTTASVSASSRTVASSGIEKQELAEPLVIKAVIGYLRGNDGRATQRARQSNRSERIVERLLFYIDLI